MRGVPVILWIYLIGFGVPGVGLERPFNSPLLWGSVALVLTYGAYIAEVFRAGIDSVHESQRAASRSLGLSNSQTMRFVILPQAFRNMLPVFLTQTIILFQDTSLVYAIGAYDMLKGFETAGKNYGRPIETYILAAATYFVICFSLSKAVRYVQARIAIIR